MVPPTKALSAMGRSGVMRSAARSSQFRPVWKLWAQKITFCPAARAVRPKTTNGQCMWQITAS